MGFFDFFDSLSPTNSQHTLSHSVVSHLFSPPKEQQCEISFDLIPTHTPHRTTIHRPDPIPVQMPLEVVLSIMETAYYDDALNADNNFLRHCSLVCRDWRMPAQKLLFSSVALRTQWAFAAFRSAVDRGTERGCMLGDSVVRMRAVLDHNQPFCLSQQLLAHAVTMCPNLYELNIALYGCGAPGDDVVGAPDVSRMQRLAPLFDDQTLSLLKSGPRITALHFANWSENHQSINQLLDVWPSLKSLVISGTPPQLPPASAEPLACSLEELRMNFQISPSVDFMKWMLHNSVDTLRILELEREPSADLLDYLIDSHGPALHSLALPSGSSQEHAMAVQRCHQLKELKIEGASTSTVVYRGLSEGLQHLALGLDRDSILHPVLDTVRSNDSLRVVTVHIWDGGDQHPQLSALKIACAYRGIDLRLTYDIRLFRAMIRGDPVSTQDFPRTKSLENLHIMRS